MTEGKEPTVAAGQELTLHPGDVPDFPADRKGFAATQEPEYDTAGGPDGRGADPLRAYDAPVFNLQGPLPALGAVTQDDPTTKGLRDRPDTGAEGDLTLVAVFEDITGAQSCADALQRRGLPTDLLLLSRRGDGPEQGTRPGNVITGDGYGLSAEEQSPPRDAGLGGGVAVGATIGATVGLLATTYVIPGFGPLVGAGSLVSTLAGAGLGSFLGGLTEYATADKGDDATLYAGQARRGGVLLLVRSTREKADEVRRAIETWNPLEIRVQ